ncbi:Hypothetical protein HVR_LOCUS840 [uncultured virus]|nr:Hypothetical protein HVR_LOCUS840 [uncultured virus]
MSLSKINHHPRDDNITFQEENHEYTILGMPNKPISVTTLIHEYFPKFNANFVITKMMSAPRWRQSKYFGRDKESIKDEWEKSGEDAARQGTIMHKGIEDFLNDISTIEPDTREFALFKTFWTDFLLQYPTLKPYRTEWLVYDEDVGVAGSIDCVMCSGDKLVILDWKRSKEIKTENKYERGIGPFGNLQNCNYHHYTLQLNFYRHILENKYGKEVIFMMLVILHPNQQSYQCYPVSRIELKEIWPTITTNIKINSHPAKHCE